MPPGKPRKPPAKPRKKPSSKKKPTTPKQRQNHLATVERDKRIIALVRAGATMQQVAEAEGLYDRQYASKCYWQAMERYGPSPQTVAQVRSRQQDRLDALMRTAWPKATNPHGPDLKWFDRVLQIHDRESRLNGTDAPSQHRHGGAKGAAPIAISTTIITDGELAELSDQELADAITAAQEAASNLTAAVAAAAVEAGARTPEEGAHTDG